jgi:hypothetical protein
MSARAGAARFVRMLVLSGLVMMAVVMGIFGPALFTDLTTRGSKLAATKAKLERLISYAQFKNRRQKAVLKALGPDKPTKPR